MVRPILPTVIDQVIERFKHKIKRKFLLPLLLALCLSLSLRTAPYSYTLFRCDFDESKNEIKQKKKHERI